MSARLRRLVCRLLGHREQLMWYGLAPVLWCGRCGKRERIREAD